MKNRDVVCLGLNVINAPLFPVDATVFTRDITQVDSIVLLPGGDAANQSIVLSRMGFNTSLISIRGNDYFGDIMLGLLRSHGANIDLSGLAVHPDKSTCMCVMLVKPDGQRHFCTHRGSMNDFSIEHVDLSMLEGAKAASIGGLCSMPSFDGSGSAEFFKAAKAQNIITVADTKADTAGIGLEGIRETLEYTDYFFPSYDEASSLSRETDPERIARVFLSAGAKNVGIKLGEKGCYVCGKDVEFSIPAIPSEVVDTTGAGDNFMAGLIAGLLKGWELRRACLFATAAAALCVSRVGPSAAVTSFEQVAGFLEASGLGV